jgi:hypothetical protein
MLLELDVQQSSLHDSCLSLLFLFELALPFGPHVSALFFILFSDFVSDQFFKKLS